MAHNGMASLFGAWRKNESALTFNCSHQVTAGRARRGLHVGVQNRLRKNGANTKALLGESYRPVGVYPRGKAWVRVAELSGL